MSHLSKPLKVWVHAPADLHRDIHTLPDDPKRIQPLTEKFHEARKQGVDAILVPISWRVLAPFHPDNVDDPARWRGYLKLFELLRQAHLQIIPDFSFAAVGLSDVQNQQLLPDWFWGKLMAEQTGDWPEDSLKFIDDVGRDSYSAPSIWARALFFPYLKQWLSAFFRHCEEFKSLIPHIQIGAGPEGELRYPLMRSQGKIERLGVFGKLAKDAFETAMLTKYGNRPGWLRAWQLEADQEPSTVELLRETRKQMEGLYQQADASERFTLSPAIRDFFDWYQQELINYGADAIGMVHQAIPEQWQCSLGLRLPFTYDNTPLDFTQGVVGAFAGLHLGEDPDQSFDFVTRLGEQLRSQTGRALCLLLSGLEKPRHSRRLSRWIEQASQTDIELMVENRSAAALADHPAWDSLMQRVLNKSGLAGWVLRDLNSVSNASETGAARLRQLGRLKHGQGEINQYSRKEFRVMGPLHLKVANQKMMLEEENWVDFESEIRQLRRIGVTAVSTDLWWGLIEGRQQGSFDWSYYDRMVEILAANDMNWVPILSFHQAGGNVNDDFSQTIPLWLWGKLIESHDELESVRDLQYVSETGDASMEYVSLWADDYVMPYYQQFMEAFREHYLPFWELIDEINVSLGPAGELRYPSYNAHDWGNYPNRGTLQCYSRLANQDWLLYLETRFKSVGTLNYAFGTRYASFSEITQPDPDELFENKNYIHSPWSREYLAWYQQALVNHGRAVLECADRVFREGDMVNIPLGVKVPGIHWEVSDPKMPRAAEITSGLIAPHPNLEPKDHDEYLKMLDNLIPRPLRDRVVLHFTCLEMVNKDYEGYSRAEDLVNWMADAAGRLGISLMGENALAGELYGKQGWKQIARALDRTPGFGGITLLRMQNFFDDDPVPLQELTKLINREQ